MLSKCAVEVLVEAARSRALAPELIHDLSSALIRLAPPESPTHVTLRGMEMLERLLATGAVEALVGMVCSCSDSKLDSRLFNYFAGAEAVSDYLEGLPNRLIWAIQILVEAARAGSDPTKALVVDFMYALLTKAAERGVAEELAEMMVSAGAIKVAVSLLHCMHNVHAIHFLIQMMHLKNAVVEAALIAAGSIDALARQMQNEIVTECSIVGSLYKLRGSEAILPVLRAPRVRSALAALVAAGYVPASESSCRTQHNLSPMGRQMVAALLAMGGERPRWALAEWGAGQGPPYAAHVAEFLVQQPYGPYLAPPLPRSRPGGPGSWESRHDGNAGKARYCNWRLERHSRL
jgi:hypothetical protein